MKVIKRLIDIIISFTALVVLSPVILIVAILVRIKLGSPVLFIQERIGKDNKVFRMYKFRTMRDATDKHGNVLPDSERLTKFGSALRSLSLDELPELINILKGDMSIVGPRPLLVEYLPLYNERQIKRHEMLPGLTGWAQINGRNLLSWEEKFEMDVWYIENWSLALDIKIFFQTILKVLKREGIDQEGGVTMERFTGSAKPLKKIAIIGSGGFGREVAWLIEEINKKSEEWDIVGFIDDNAEKHGSVINNYKVLGGVSYLEENKDIYYVCAIGSAKVKAKVVKRCDEIGLKAATLIHPDIAVCKTNTIGEGSIICAGTIITVNTTIGKHVIVNLSCTIGHDAILQDFVTVYPGVCISGNTNFGKGVELGTKSAVIQGLEIGDNTIVGAGSVVVKNLPANCTAVGIPAKPIKFFEVEE